MSAVGIIGKKVGMTHIFDETGNSVPVTVIEAGPCPIVQIKTTDKEGYNSLQVGFESVPKHKLNKPMQGHYKKHDVQTTRRLTEFRVNDVDGYTSGQELKVEQFQAGDLVNVQGKQIGKGFMGTVKRHNFGRGPMSHGSKNHRAPGSIGAGTTPSRVYKGQKMAGRIPNKVTTVTKLQVISVDTERNLLLVKGSTPGVKGTVLKITPSKKGAK